MQKINTILITFLIITCAATGYCIVAINRISANLKTLDARKDKELQMRLAKEREFVKKDLDEKYRADMVSYAAMAKRLEAEKKRIKDLEEKIKGSEAMADDENT